MARQPAGIPLRLVLAGIWLALPAIPSLAREVEPLESNWHFHLGETAAAESNTLDDSSWETVSLPHNWGWQEAEQGKHYYRGPGWYRRAFNIPGKPASDISSDSTPPVSSRTFTSRAASRPASRRLWRVLF